MQNPTTEKIRLTVLTEGISFLILLFVAMPLKYFADLPLAVKWVGWVHGFLFILLCGLLFWGLVTRAIRFKQAMIVFISSLIPFAPFMINHQLKQNQSVK